MKTRPALRFIGMALVLLATRVTAAPAGDSPQPAENAVVAKTIDIPVQTVWPRSEATNVCPDTPLRVNFAESVSLAGGGRIHIVDAGTGEIVDLIDTSSTTATKAIGGESGYRYRPVIIDGGEAVIYPRNGALQYGRSYRVSIDAGVFRSAAHTCASVTWTFTTKRAPPPPGTTLLTVAADGSGDFCTVQGAIDFIPAGNTRPITIRIRNGTYREMVFITNRHSVTLVGEDRRQVLITYETNERFNPARGNPFGDPIPDPSGARLGGAIYHRGVFLAHRVNDLVLANLTIRNSTPQGGSQAEALILNGTTTARAILKDLDLRSHQDTLQTNGQTYISGCSIDGDVDFMWGTGPCFFEGCTFRSLRSGAYYTQVRNPEGNHGFVFVRCQFGGAEGIVGNYLSRISTARFPHSEVVLLDCTLSGAVHPAGWQLQGAPANVRFWEYNSRDPAGSPVDTSRRLPMSRQLSLQSDAEIIHSYRNPMYVLGNGWDPRLATIFKGN